LFKRFAARVRYLIDRAFAREIAGQLLLLFVLTFSVTLIGMTAIFFGLFAEENSAVEGIPQELDQSFLDALWWSFNLVLDLRGFNEMYGSSGAILVYSLFLALVGLVALSLLISLINNTMRSRIDALRSGGTPVLEKNHVLILGWNNKVFSVLRQLAQLQPGQKVVILAPREIDYMQENLRLAGISQEALTVILRSGVPSNRSELERVAINQARSVIILATDAADSETIKALVLLAGKNDWTGQAPTLTCEIAEAQSEELARIAARGRVNLISSSTIISKVIVQTIRHPGLASVFAELFAVEGNNLYVQQVPESTDSTVEDNAYHFADAVPIGLTWKKNSGGSSEHAVALNPEPDYDIAADEQLVFVARQFPVRYSPQAQTPTAKATTDTHEYQGVPQRVLLIGWSSTIDDILVEMDAHAVQGTEVTMLSRMSPKATQLRFSELELSFSNIALQLLQANVTSAAAYEELDLQSFESVVVLSDDEADGGDIDTRTLRVLLRLTDLRKYDALRAHTVVELTDAGNLDLLTHLDVDDVVVSSDMVSAQLAQVAQQPVLGPIYRELLSVGGVEIALRPASHYINSAAAVNFYELVSAAQQKLEIALGVRLGSTGEVLLNPARDQTWELGEDDQVVVLAQQIYQ
jgi:hypothetical protein